jgi:phosphatidylserine/phosphatidylglycerophosphate/cardiolipin synthase-like enzyme
MNRQTWSMTGVVLLGLVFAGRYLAIPGASAAPEAGQDIACYFSPKGGCTDAVVAEIARAQQTILIQAYSFTSTPIAKALVEAHQRGVQITVILDKSNLTGQYSSADFVLHASIPTYIDDKHAIAHNKIMLIDGRTIITGSFNFTKQAESSNAENLLVIRDHPELFAQYQANFQRHLDHSQTYQGRAKVESAGLQGDTASEPQAKTSRRRR